MDIVENDQSQGLPELTKPLTSGACGVHDKGGDRGIEDNRPAATWRFGGLTWTTAMTQPFPGSARRHAARCRLPATRDSIS
jgi:hypothetical protein